MGFVFFCFCCFFRWILSGCFWRFCVLIVFLFFVMFFMFCWNQLSLLKPVTDYKGKRTEFCVYPTKSNQDHIFSKCMLRRGEPVPPPFIHFRTFFFSCSKQICKVVFVCIQGHTKGFDWILCVSNHIQPYPTISNHIQPCPTMSKV